MSTQVVTVTGQVELTEAVRLGINVLIGGGLVVFPTETVYGVAGRADMPETIVRLRQVKGRSNEKALTVHLGTKEDARKYVNRLPGVAQRLMRKGWPGPLTLVLPVEEPGTTELGARLSKECQDAIYYSGTIGLRCPDDPVAEGILRGVSAPVIASSANPGGASAPFTGMDAKKALDGQVDLLIDSGRTRFAKASTVVRIMGQTHEVLREGVLDARVIDRMAMLRIVFVCTGNTCRSPMAAGLARKMLAEKIGCAMGDLPLRGVLVESAGTSGGVGRASVGAVAAMEKRGIDLSEHTSSSLQAEMLRQADFVFAMTRSHRDAALAMAPSAADRIRMLIDEEDIVDPIGGTVQEYDACAERIARGLEMRMRELTL